MLFVSRLSHRNNNLTFQWRNFQCEQTFLLVLRVFKPFPKTMKQQQSITTTLYVSQFIFFLFEALLLLFLLKTYIFFIFFFVSLLKHDVGEKKRKKILSHLKWLPIYCEIALIRDFSSFSLLSVLNIFLNLYFLWLYLARAKYYERDRRDSSRRSFTFFHIKNSQHGNVQFFRNLFFCYSLKMIHDGNLIEK